MHDSGDRLANSLEAHFDETCQSRDPRSYFELLGALDFLIADLACPVIMRLAECMIERKQRPITILDLNCSYGVLAAVSRHGLNIAQLRARYLNSSVQALSSEAVVGHDGHFFASWPARSDIRFVGLDRSKDAIAYACRVGLLDEGVAVDLETNSLNQRARSVISKADVIVSIGADPRLSDRTFTKLLSVFESCQQPWIISFVPRTFDFSDIVRAIAKYNLKTRRISGATFVQRRFRNGAEREKSLQILRDKGIDANGKEADGLLHAELFVSSPPGIGADNRLVDDLLESVGLANGRPCIVGSRLADR